MAPSLEKKRSEVAIVGAGLVGTLSAIYFARHGYHVDIYEARKDPRNVRFLSQRSINLALSYRGICALKAAGCEQPLVESGVPMYGRFIHTRSGRTHTMRYGNNHQCIYSVERRKINEYLLTVAEGYKNVDVHFEHKLQSVDLDNATFTCSRRNNTPVEVEADLLVGCDGAYSAVRKEMMKQKRFDYSQTYIPHGYKEICLPPNPDGQSRMDVSYLHIWPRTSFMMIAQPNRDNSFTCTLFAPYELFDGLNTKENIVNFFKKEFPDFLDLIGKQHLLDEFLRNPVGSMLTVKCKPYHYKNKAIILGDAAHAMVPFYAQGMNCGFEDCLVLDELLHKHHRNLGAALAEYSRVRNPDAEAICDLAMYNYIEMRSSVNSSSFLWRRKLYAYLHWLMPRVVIPLYTMVTFSRIRYHEVLVRWRRQDKVLNALLTILFAGTISGLVQLLMRLKWTSR